MKGINDTCNNIDECQSIISNEERAAQMTTEFIPFIWRYITVTFIPKHVSLFLCEIRFSSSPGKFHSLSQYKPTPKYINHLFLTQLFGSFSYRNYILKRFFISIFPQKMWIPQGQGSSLLCIPRARQWLIHDTFSIHVEQYV